MLTVMHNDAKLCQRLQNVCIIWGVFGQVEQRSELVDIVTKLAKEEAAAEKGAAAAAKADAAAISFADMPEDIVTQTATKTNAAAALKQVQDLLCHCDVKPSLM